MISTQTIFCKYCRCAPFRKFTSDSTATVRIRSGDSAQREVWPKTVKVICQNSEVLGGIFGKQQKNCIILGEPVGIIRATLVRLSASEVARPSEIASIRAPNIVNNNILSI